MNLDQLDYAVMQRNHRKRAIDLRRAAASGFFAPVFTYEGVEHRPDSVFPLDVIRNAVIAECDKFVAEKDAELRALGVEP